MFLLTLRYANITLFIPSVKNTSFRFALSFCSFFNNYALISLMICFTASSSLFGSQTNYL